MVHVDAASATHLSQLPYLVQPSRAKFLGLVPGRRKAIEVDGLISGEIDSTHDIDSGLVRWPFKRNIMLKLPHLGYEI